MNDNDSSAPEVSRRKKPKTKKWLFLPDELWDELSFAAKFQTRAFELTGDPEEISRNDFIEDALLWALPFYWQDKGGRPKDEKDFEVRAKAYAKRIEEKERRKGK